MFLLRRINSSHSTTKSNLKKRDFRDKDLTNFDLKGCDIRGANFSNAVLRGADLSYTTTGMPFVEEIIFIILSLIILSALGFMAGLSGVLMGFAFSSAVIHKYTFLPGLSSLVCLIHFLYNALKLGYWPALKTLISSSIFVFSSLAFAVVYSIYFQYPVISFAGILSGISSIFLCIATSGAVAIGVTSCLSIIGATYTALGGLAALSVAFLITATLAISGIDLGNVFLKADNNFAFYISIITSLSIVLFGAQIGWQALRQPEHFLMTRRLTLSLLSFGGTNFRGADLTDAKFHHAIVKNANFKDAVLTRTLWFKSSKIETSRVDEKHYLENPSVQSLVVSHQGVKKEFDNLNLQGINLQNANLCQASFIGANLNFANLRNANLTGAKLKQSQLDYADLSGAVLTGAYIEDWGITTRTKLDGIRCDYIFMRLPTEGHTDPNPRRKPDDWSKTFAEGEFAEFITPMVETLDLYHNQTIDPRAIAIAFHELREQNPNADLELVSIEKRGRLRDKFLIRAEASPQADLSELSKKYFDRYEYLLTLPPEAIRTLIIEKEEQVKMLSNIVNTAVSKPSHTTIDNYFEQGDNLMPGSSKYDMRGSQFAGGFAETVQGDQIGGTVQSFHGSVGNVTDTKTSIMTAYISQNGDDITRLLIALRETAQQFPEAQKDEALMELADLETDLKTPEKQNPKRIGKRLQRLLAARTAAAIFAGGAATLSGDINEFTGNVLELAERVGLSQDAIQPN